MHTHAETTDYPNTPERRLLDRLVRARLPDPYDVYAYFWVTGEGKYLPALIDGQRVEIHSGYLIDADGRIYRFWLGWDAEEGQPTFARWGAADPQADWATDSEYQAARRQVGLAA
jgi:hypothetical protein